MRFILLFILSLSVFAESINLVNLNYSHNTQYAFIEDAYARNSLIPQNYRWLFSANYSFVDDPLLRTDEQRENRIETIVDQLQTVGLAGAYAFSSRLQLGFNTNLHYVDFDDTQTTESDFSLGDSRVTLKYRLTDNGAPVQSAVMLDLILPTGDPELYTSDDSVGGAARFVLEKKIFSRLMVTGNIGYQSVSGARAENLDYRDMILWGIGGLYEVYDDLHVNLEWLGRTNQFTTDKEDNPSDIYGGIRYQLHRKWALFAGAGLGNSGDNTGTDPLLIAGVKWTPSFKRPRERKYKMEKTNFKAKPKVMVADEKVTVDQAIPFEFNSAQLNYDAKFLLEEVAASLDQHIDIIKNLEIAGHTDFIGDDDYNMNLSQRRADSVKAFLITLGIPEDRMTAIGYGETRPIIQTTSKKEAAINRRVEFNLTRR